MLETADSADGVPTLYTARTDEQDRTAEFVVCLHFLRCDDSVLDFPCSLHTFVQY